MIDVALLKPEDPRWKEFLDSVEHDFYHLPQYLKLSGEFEGGEGLAFLARSSNGSALFVPMLIRSLPDALESPDLKDAVTPYGYPSPLLYAPESDPGTLNELVQSFRDFCIDQKIVSFFARLHPLLTDAEAALDSLGDQITHGETVYVDLSLSEAEIKSTMRSDHRAAIRKTQRLGYTLQLDTDGIQTFYDLYSATMARLKASEFYFFSLDYFNRLARDLPDTIKTFTYYSPDGEPVSSMMVGTCGKFIQAHLIGTAASARKLSPGKAVFHEISLWGSQNGYSLYHLGGGLGGKSDSLFKFKSAFSDKRATFKTWRCIMMDAEYASLTEKSRTLSESREDEHFFPSYRLGIGR